MATYFGTKQARAMGFRLYDITDQYPMTFLTERSFYPAVVTYLVDRYPKLHTEFKVAKGEVDFKIGGVNPALLELAVQPRQLQDANSHNIKFPGHNQATCLYSSANRSELEKLKHSTVSVKSRILLLIDLTNKYAPTKLFNGYVDMAAKVGGPHKATVILIQRHHAYHLNV